MQVDDTEPSVELATLTSDGEALDPIPLVFIEGWAAGTPAKIFHGLDALLNEGRPSESVSRRLLVVKCGAYSSLWDRAHEIYYALKGGVCDYGQEHSLQHGHARYGKTHTTGLYEDWSVEYPLHFAGHSFGGATICHLQQLLVAGILPGDPAMMRSVIPISSPLRGTPLAASLGQLDGPGAGQKRFSISWMMAIAVHFAKSANVVANDIYDFGGDQWTDTQHAEDTESSRGIMDSFSHYFPGNRMACSSDSAGYDMLVDVMENHNTGFELCEETFYRSFTAATTIPLHLPPLAYCHYLITSHADQLQLGADWRDNDGFIPVASQMHPADCDETTCLHIPADLTLGDEPPPLPGVWHVKSFHDTTHFGLVDYLWKLRNSTKTTLFWVELGEWLRIVDQESESVKQEGRSDHRVSIVDGSSTTNT